MEAITIDTPLLKPLQEEKIDNHTLVLVKSLVANRHPEAERVVKNFIGKRDINPALQAGFISLLKAFPGDETEGQLLRLISHTSPVVRSHAAVTLMKIGTATTLAALDQKNIGEDEQLSFVHTVIAHRLGVPATHLRLPAAENALLPTGNTSTITAQPLTALTHRNILSSLATTSFQLAPYTQEGLEINCAGGHSALLLQAPLGQRGLQATFRKPRLLGTLLNQNEEYQTWSFSRVILGGPLGRNQFYIAVFRKDGKLVYYGTGNSANQQVTLHAAKMPGAFATTIQCSWADNTLTLKGVASTKPETPNRPVERK